MQIISVNLPLNLEPLGMRTSVRDASRELPEKVLAVMLVVVFLTNCCRVAACVRKAWR